MSTKQRILEAALQLFNAQSEPQVTTNHIADEINISPGNLYYHYKNKEDIVFYLYEQHEQQVKDALITAIEPDAKIETVWLTLHLLFEAIWVYRFFYRDLNHILSVNDKVRKRYQRLLNKQIETIEHLFLGLIDCGQMQANPQDVSALTHNVVLGVSYWLNYQKVLNNDVMMDEDKRITHGVYQIMSLLLPYLSEEPREQIRAIAHVYMNRAT